MAGKEWIKIGDHLYRRRGLIYWRSQVDGRRSWVKLNATTIHEAREEVTKLIHKSIAPQKDLISLLNFYLDHSCPKRNEQPRTGRQLHMEIRRVVRLLEYFRLHPPLSITHATLRHYREWRGETRACELDIATLSAACRWAYRNPDQTGITSNPMPTDRPRFAPPKKHCRDKQPANAGDLHSIARHLMNDPRSGCMGWMILFMAFTGLRLERARFLRMDATNHDAGHHDGECIWVGVSQTHKGVFPFIKIHDALKQWWDAFQEWRLARGVSSPWYFPSPRNQINPVARDALGQAMRRTCKRLGIPACSPHGLRSYYVNVLRSQGVMDAEIALRIGHRSGGRLIVDVYGEVLPHTITFIPSSGPAWDLVTTMVTTQGAKLHQKRSVTEL